MKFKKFKEWIKVREVTDSGDIAQYARPIAMTNKKIPMFAPVKKIDKKKN